MAGFGHLLSCEEHTPAELVDQARKAEQAGFESLWRSDHYRPWHGGQGRRPCLWSGIGALFQAVSPPVEPAVTRPLPRTRPAVIARAAAISAVQKGQQRFFDFYRTKVPPRLRD